MVLACNFEENKNPPMSFIIRRATKADTPACHQLIQELADFEKAPNAVTNTLEQFTNDGFGPNPVYTLFVAEEENVIVGMSLLFTAYSTWKGKMLWLDDLIVNEAHRGKGIGKALVDNLFEYARKNDYKIIKWQVLDWNAPAIEFYKKLGMTLDGEWIDCKYYLD